MAGLATVDSVSSHVPSFIRSSPGGVTDNQIQAWIDARWGEIQTILSRRALAVPDQVASPDAYNTLELINRLGAASDLAAALSVKFAQQPWPVSKNLRDDFLRMLQRLDSGEFDKQLAPQARTENVGAQIAAVAGQELDPEPDHSLNVAVFKNMKF